MISVDLRKQRIREIKVAIVESNKELLEKLTSAKTEEDRAALKEVVELSKVNRKALEDELKELRMNKLGSRFTTFTPSQGNRRQAKQYRKQRRLNGNSSKKNN